LISPIRSRSAVAAIICAIALAVASALAGPARAQLPREDDASGAQGAPGGVAAHSSIGAQGAPGEPQVSLEYFRELLSPSGTWFTHPVWGDVWQPDAGPDFRPYFDGYWEYTSDHGSLWISNEPFGDIVYHYGRWVFDRSDGWLWVPGYVWGPSWVVWRANQYYVGWLPMPPGYLDYQRLFTSPYLSDNWYGYQTFYGPTFVSEHYFTLWIFVLNKDFGHRGRHRHVTDIRKLRELYHGSADCTRYVIDKDRVVDRFIDRDWWQRRAGRIVDARPAREHLRRDVPVTSVSQGRNISRRYAQDDRGPRGERAAAQSSSANEPGARQVPAPGLASPARPFDRAARDRAGAALPDSGGRTLGRRNIGPVGARTSLGARPDTAPSNPLPPDGAPGPRALAGGTRPYTDGVTGVSVRRGLGSVAGPRQTDGAAGNAVRRAGSIAGASPPLQSSSGVTATPPSSPAPAPVRPSGRGSLSGGLSGGAQSLFQRRGF